MFWRDCCCTLGRWPVAEDSTSRSSDVVPESSIIASRMEDAIHESVDEPCSSF
jgi:hypothetical protein